MGNEAGSKSSSKKSNLKANWIKLSDTEKQGVISYTKKYIDQTNNNKFKSENFFNNVFTYISKEVSTNINKYLNSFYSEIKVKRQLTPEQNLEITDIMTLAQILIKSTLDSDENIYYHKSMIQILYDIIHGELYYWEKHKDNLDMEIIIKIFNFIILIYFNKYAKKSMTLKFDTKELFNSEFNSNIKEFILCNILNKYKLSQDDFNTKITSDQLNELQEKKLKSLDGFTISHFSTLLFNLERDPNNENMTSFPIFNEPPSTLSIYKFFFYCLSNSIISSKHYAFKLYDCKVNGYNISNLVYSFLGLVYLILKMQNWMDLFQYMAVILR